MASYLRDDPAVVRQSAAFVLGITPDADDLTALEAFRAAAARHHPHAGGDLTVYQTVVAAWAAWNATGHVVLTDDDLEASLEGADELAAQRERAATVDVDRTRPLDAASRLRRELLAVEAEQRPVVAPDALTAADRTDGILVLDEDAVEDEGDVIDLVGSVDVAALPPAHRAYATAGSLAGHERQLDLYA